jgi:hypothetical protein
MGRPILRRRHPVGATEARREGAQAPQPDGQADVGDRAVGRAEESRGPLEAPGEQVPVGRLPELAPKLAAEVGRREPSRARERLHVERLAVAGVDQILRTEQVTGWMRRTHPDSVGATPSLRRERTGEAAREDGSPGDAQLEAVRRRRFPIVGDGEGILSFVRLDDAASATVLAVERGRTGVYNIVDDDPASAREWVPALAETIGAKPPRHVPRWLAHMFAGGAGLVLMTEARGASNAKAKRELGWTLRHPSWREGFRASYVTHEAKAA